MEQPDPETNNRADEIDVDAYLASTSIDHDSQAKETNLSDSGSDGEKGKKLDATFSMEESEVVHSDPVIIKERELELYEVEEEDDEPLLTEDAYSLLYTSKFCGRTSAFAWFAIFLQGGMLLVTFFDLYDISPKPNTTNDETNRMAVPANSTVQVQIAQFVGMLVTAMVMAAGGDLVVGITRLIKGYNPRMRELSPHATWFRWLSTALLQSVVGLFLLIDSFILSMQSSTVIDLVLNLTALHFIQEIDEIAFTIAAETGLLGKKVQQDCEHVRNLKCFSSPNQRRRIKMFRRFLILAVTAGLLIPFFRVVARQSNGHYICQTLYIQFGDEYRDHEMAYYSGLFRSQGNSISDRWSYGQRNRYIDDTNTLKLSYCKADSIWTVSYLDDHACDYIYRSTETDTFDVIEAADENWLINTESTGDIDADWLKIVCNDCTEDTCHPDHGMCSPDMDACECLPGRYGVNCQYEEKCSWFALDQRTTDGLSSISGASYLLEQEYSLFSEVSFNGMPIYRPMNFNATSGEYNSPTYVSTFIVFTGRRWALYGLPDEKLANVVSEYGIPADWSYDYFYDIFDSLMNITTGYYAVSNLTSVLPNLRPIFYSAPLNYGESSFDLSSVTWVLASKPRNGKFADLMTRVPDEQQSIAAQFVCTVCTEAEYASNTSGVPCLNDGFCGETGNCVCPTFYAGYLCEKVKDCVSAGGCSPEGRCNEETKICECNEGSYGSLCHLGKGEEYFWNPYLCNECRVTKGSHGECENTFSQECICEEGWSGTYCDEWIGDSEETQLFGQDLNTTASSETESTVPNDDMTGEIDPEP